MPTGQREAGKVSHPESGVPVARDAHPHHLGGIRLQTGCPPRADPQQNLEKARARDSPGIGRGFQAPLPAPESPGCLARWKSRARPETRRRCREIRRKTSAFFFLSGTRSPPALTHPAALAPTWGTTPSAWRSAPSPPAANRRAPFARLCGLTNRGGGRAARATPPFAQFYKRRRLWPRAQIAEARDARVCFSATWIIAGTLHNSFRLAWEGFAPFRRSWTSARASWEGFGFSDCRFCVFSRGIVVERFPLWIITAP